MSQPFAPDAIPTAARSPRHIAPRRGRLSPFPAVSSRSVERASRHSAQRVRSAAFAVSAVGLALGAHVTAGGVVPALPLVLLLVVLIEGIAATFARQRRSPAVIAIGLVGAQAFLHSAFTLVTPSGHAHPVLPSGSMMLAHGVATLLLAGLLHRGEELLERLTHLLLPLVVLLPYRPLPATRMRLRAPRMTVVCDRTALLHDLTRRGPPAPHDQEVRDRPARGRGRRAPRRGSQRTLPPTFSSAAA